MMKLKCRLGLHNYEFQKATKIMRHTVRKYQCLSCGQTELRSETLDMKPANEFGKPLAFYGDTDFYGTLDEMEQLIAELEQVVNFDAFNIDMDKDAVTIKDMDAIAKMFKLIRHLPFAFQAFLLGGQHGNLEAFSTIIRQLYDASLNMFATVVDYHKEERDE